MNSKDKKNEENQPSSKYEDSIEVPEIVRRFRENYDQYDDKTLVKLYFELLNKIREDASSEKKSIL